MAGSVVEHRAVDPAVATGTLLVPKGDPAGRAVVTGDAAAPVPTTPAPADLTAYGRDVYRTAGPTFYENEANVPAPGGGAYPRVLELLYVQLGKVLANAGVDLYVLVVDKAAAIAVGDGSVTPMPYLARAGEMIVWEPPEGFRFANGIRIIVSTDPNVYAAPGVAEPISVTCRTRNA